MNQPVLLESVTFDDSNQPPPKAAETTESTDKAQAWTSPPVGPDETGSSGEALHDSHELDESLRGTRMPVHYLESQLQNTVRDGQLLRELFIYIPFLVMFVVFSLSAFSVENAHYAVAALKQGTMLEPWPIASRQNRTAWEATEKGEVPIMDTDLRFKDLGELSNYQDFVQFLVPQLTGCQSQLDAKASFANPSSNASFNATSISMGTASTATTWNPFRGQLLPIGGFRLRTQRVRNDSCVISADVTNRSYAETVCSESSFPFNTSSGNSSTSMNLTMTPRTCVPNPFPKQQQQCFGAAKFENEQRLSPLCNKPNPFDPHGHPLYEYKLCPLVTGVPTTTELDVYHCGGYVVDIPYNTTCDAALQFLDTLNDEDCPFVDDQSTRLFIVEWFTYSANLDLYYSVKLIVEVTSGGGFITSDQYRAFVVQTAARQFYTVFDFFFLAYVLYYLLDFGLNWRRFVKQEGKILMYLADVWTLLDLANVVTYMAVFILRWMWWSYCDSYEKHLPATSYPDELERILFTYSQMRYAIAFNFILTFLKILKFLKVSDRFSVISNTFEKAQSDVLGLIVLFALFVTGFALSGHFLFGYAMYDFSNLDRSYTGLMLMLLGELDYTSMKQVNPILTGLFFWLYLIIAFFLILNFIVAVIGDAFSAAGQEQFIAPLDVALMQTLGGIWFTIKPRNLVNQCKLIAKRKSILAVEMQMLSYVKNSRLLLEMKNPGALDIFVSAEEVFRWLPPPVRKDAGYLFNFRWRQFHEEYRLFSSSGDQQVRQERTESIVEGTRTAMLPFDATAADTSKQMDRVADLCDQLASKIQEISVRSARASSDGLNSSRSSQLRVRRKKKDM